MGVAMPNIFASLSPDQTERFTADSWPMTLCVIWYATQG